MSIISSVDPIRAADSQAWSLEAGWQTVKTWEGSKAAIQALAVQLTADGATSLTINGDGSSMQLKATFPNAQDTTIDSQAAVENIAWELQGNELEKNLRTHPSIFDPVSPGANDRADLNKADDYIAHPTDVTPGDVAALYQGAEDYYDLRSMGVDSYIVSQYVLRKTIKVGIDSDVQAAYTNINLVESPDFNDGIVKLFSLPTNFAGESGGIEWLKRTPTVTVLGKGKYSIVQEWWSASKWSQLLYGGTSLP